VRFGDMLAAGVVFLGTQMMALSTTGFAVTNLVFLAGAILVGLLLLRENRRVSEATAAPAAA
jgi:hypothetical protein